MVLSSEVQLSRRERQIMDTLFRLGSATAAEIHRSIPNPPTLDTIRKLIRILEGKGHLSHEKDGKQHVYRPAVEAPEARRGALSHVVETFFSGSFSSAFSTLFDISKDRLSAAEAEELARLIERTEEEEP